MNRWWIRSGILAPIRYWQFKNGTLAPLYGTEYRELPHYTAWDRRGFEVVYSA